MWIFDVQHAFSGRNRNALLMNLPLSLSARVPTNVWMDDMSPADRGIRLDRAIGQFQELYRHIARQAIVYVLPSRFGLQDQTYVSNLGVVLASQAEDTRDVHVSLDIYDLYDKKVFERDLAATIEPFEQHRLECALPELPFGSFRAVLSNTEDHGVVLDELSMSVMPDVGRVDCVGVHCFLCQYGLDVAARFGAQWDRLWDGAPTTGHARLRLCRVSNDSWASL